MKYKVFIAQVEKITSPVIVHFEGQMKEFANGIEMADFEFDVPYVVSEIMAENRKIIIRLELQKTNDSIVSFF